MDKLFLASDGEFLSYAPHTGRSARAERNWRVQRYAEGEVVAIEPGRDYETPFYGADAFQEALDFAARELRNGDRNERISSE